jgi:hypothetical protein
MSDGNPAGRQKFDGDGNQKSEEVGAKQAIGNIDNEI